MSNMSRGARSVFVFSFYLFAMGLVLYLFPKQMMTFGGFPVEGLTWVRFNGMLLFLVAFYYQGAARTNDQGFMVWCGWTRLVGEPLLVGGMVLFGWAPARILMFVPLDVLGGLWTLYAVRQDRSEATPTR